MTMHPEFERTERRPFFSLGRGAWLVYAAFVVLSTAPCATAVAQGSAAGSVPVDATTRKVQELTSAMAIAQAQIEANQKLLLELQQELATLKLQVAHDQLIEAPRQGSSSSGSLDGTTKDGAKPIPNVTGETKSLDEMSERQAMIESQIATHESTKVETQSKYPLTLSGLVLFNSFINTRQVDVAASPAYVIPGPGNTGLSIKQTVLGLDARGPHLFGAVSHADIRVDFFSGGSQTNYASGGGLRLRTAHAGLQWTNTDAFFSYDRTFLEPELPTSLLAVGQPELSWSGNLWTWNPQVGVSHAFHLSDRFGVETQVALIDASDPHLPSVSASPYPASRSELSRWPGTESRIALKTGSDGLGPELGLGGYFSPHRALDNTVFHAWAGTVDLRLPITHYAEITSNAYRGQALGGLGGGGYVDYVYRYVGDGEYARALDDVGGWVQLKVVPTQRWEINSGYGVDNPFAKEVMASLQSSMASTYPGLIRNRTYYGNVIYTPSKYLLFSMEYRRLWSSYATDQTVVGNVIGLGAGYKF